MAKQGRKISAKALLDDIRSGMSDAELLRKHGVSQKSLEKFFDQLVAKGLISAADLDRRSALAATSVKGRPAAPKGAVSNTGTGPPKAAAQPGNTRSSRKTAANDTPVSRQPARSQSETWEPGFLSCMWAGLKDHWLRYLLYALFGPPFIWLGWLIIIDLSPWGFHNSPSWLEPACALSSLCWIALIPLFARRTGHPLNLAIKRSNLHKVQSILHRGIDPNAVMTNRKTLPLQVALDVWVSSGKSKSAWDRRTAVIHALLEAGADPNVSERGGPHVLIQACKRGMETDVRSLLDAGADVNTQDKDGRTPLWHACLAGSVPVCETLWNAGGRFSPNDDPKPAVKLLEKALIRDSQPILEWLKSIGVDTYDGAQEVMKRVQEKLGGGQAGRRPLPGEIEELEQAIIDERVVWHPTTEDSDKCMFRTIAMGEKIKVLKGVVGTPAAQFEQTIQPSADMTSEQGEIGGAQGSVHVLKKEIQELEQAIFEEQQNWDGGIRANQQRTSRIHAMREKVGARKKRLATLAAHPEKAVHPSMEGRMAEAEALQQEYLALMAEDLKKASNIGFGLEHPRDREIRRARIKELEARIQVLKQQLEPPEEPPLVPTGDPERDRREAFKRQVGRDMMDIMRKAARGEDP